MKGDDKVIEYLNTALKNELTAINQYFLHYRMLNHWGVKRLAKFEYEESIDEMKHADKLAERILFLDGLPNFQLLGRLRIGSTVEEVLQADLETEMEAIPLLRDAIAYCETVRDYVSRDLFQHILDNEEEPCRHDRDAVRDESRAWASRITSSSTAKRRKADPPPFSRPFSPDARRHGRGSFSFPLLSLCVLCASAR